jgi:hypothetical protein
VRYFPGRVVTEAPRVFHLAKRIYPSMMWRLHIKGTLDRYEWSISVDHTHNRRWDNTTKGLGPIISRYTYGVLSWSLVIFGHCILVLTTCGNRFIMYLHMNRVPWSSCIASSKLGANLFIKHIISCINIILPAHANANWLHHNGALWRVSSKLMPKPSCNKYSRDVIHECWCKK